MDIADLSALLGEETAGQDYAGIWVAAPEGQALSALLGEARRLADGVGCYVHAVVSGKDEALAAIWQGADEVYVAAEAGAYLRSQRPEFVLLEARQTALAARLAQHFGAGLITDVAGSLEVDPETRALSGKHPVYRGDYLIEAAVTTPVKVATLDARRLGTPAPDHRRTGEVLTADAMEAEGDVRDLGPADAYSPPSWRPLSKAKVIVAIGRGARDVEGLDLAKRLAQALGAEFAGDRSARDAGWVDEAHEVGVTGQEVAPDVYLALGIRGDTVHNAAITGARNVIAVYPDAEAPIFRAADVCVAAEVKPFLRALLEHLR